MTECFYRVPQCPKGHLAIASPFGRVGPKVIMHDGQILRRVYNERHDQQLIAIYNARVVLTELQDKRVEVGCDALGLCAELEQSRPYWTRRTIKTFNWIRRVDGLFDSPVKLKTNDNEQECNLEPLAQAQD